MEMISTLLFFLFSGVLLKHWTFFIPIILIMHLFSLGIKHFLRKRIALHVNLNLTSSFIPAIFLYIILVILLLFQDIQLIGETLLGVILILAIQFGLLVLEDGLLATKNKVVYLIRIFYIICLTIFLYVGIINYLIPYNLKGSQCGALSALECPLGFTCIYPPPNMETGTDSPGTCYRNINLPFSRN